MLVQFQISYKTHIGQEMMIVGSNAELGIGSKECAKLMVLKNAEAGTWVFLIEISSEAEFTYRYFVRDHNFNTSIDEWGPDRIFKSGSSLNKTILLADCWRSMSDPEFALHSSAFINAILKPGIPFKVPAAKKTEAHDTVILKFKPSIVRIKPGHRVAVSGSAKSLGSWNEKKVVSLGNPFHPQWCG